MTIEMGGMLRAFELLFPPLDLPLLRLVLMLLLKLLAFPPLLALDQLVKDLDLEQSEGKLGTPLLALDMGILFFDMKLEMKLLALERTLQRLGQKLSRVVLLQPNQLVLRRALMHLNLLDLKLKLPSLSMHPPLSLLLGINLYLPDLLMDKLNQLSPPNYIKKGQGKLGIVMLQPGGK